MTKKVSVHQTFVIFIKKDLILFVTTNRPLYKLKNHKTQFTFRNVDRIILYFEAFVEQKQSKKGSSSIGSGKQTLRLRSTGPATVEDVSIVIIYKSSLKII